MMGTDNEKFDIDIKKSLNAAFEKEQISVSEDLIASTLAKIRSLDRSSNGEASSEAVHDMTSSRTVSERDTGVVSIAEAKRKHSGIIKIAGSVAAALIIGIVGIGILKGGSMTKHSENATESASAPREYAESAQETECSDSYDMQMEATESTSGTEEPRADLNTSLAAYGNDEAVSFSEDDIRTADKGAQVNIIQDSGLEQKEMIATDSSNEIAEDDAVYSFQIPTDLSESVGEVLSKYTADILGPDELAKANLVIGNGFFFFTDNDTLTPDSEDTIHTIEDPGTDIGLLAEEIDELIK